MGHESCLLGRLQESLIITKWLGRESGIWMTTMNILIEVISDPVCRWCYVGKRRLEAALARRPDIGFTVVWRPYQLNPNMPREGRNRQAYYREKFGPERAEMLLSGLRQTGAEEGISFCDDVDAMAPNTLSAHVLMYWADADERISANDVAEKLFQAHHVACEDIGDHAVLSRIADEVGMDATDVAARLAAGEDEDTVKKQVAESAGRGVSGVPFFVINGRYAISGAQSADTLVSAFDQMVDDKSVIDE